MRCFEIWINGQRRCTVGLNRNGVISATATIQGWSRAGGERQHRTDVRVGGLEKIDDDHSQHLDWLTTNLAVGDEILIKLVDSDVRDEPTVEPTRFEGCGFCGRSRTEIPEGELLGGAEANICKDCIIRLRDECSAGENPSTATDAEQEQSICSFCGKRSDEVPQIFAGQAGRICQACLTNCALVPLGKR